MLGANKVSLTHKLSLFYHILYSKRRFKTGFYSDSYFLRTKEILSKDKHHPRIVRATLAFDEHITERGFPERDLAPQPSQALLAVTA
jgi:hypothetical protein